VIGGNMNRHIASERRGYKRIHGGYGFGEGNKVGKRVMDFALPYNLAVINTYFRKWKSII